MPLELATSSLLPSEKATVKILLVTAGRKIVAVA
jgi:hypothetical protein